jgi:hypothetical protein
VRPADGKTLVSNEDDEVMILHYSNHIYI